MFKAGLYPGLLGPGADLEFLHTPTSIPPVINKKGFDKNELFSVNQIQLDLNTNRL